MRPATLDILRCPYCGGRLELVDSLPHRHEGDAVIEGILGCLCCIFPVVSGIPVLHLQPSAVSAREALEEGDPDRAFRILVSEDEEHARRFAEAATTPGTTFRELADTLGEELESVYFLYRFSDPSYVVASAVVSAVAGTVLEGGGRAIDVCGGSGHLTRLLLEVSTPAPVIADLYFAKLWLAAHRVAPGCEPVCCDGNAPLPFARGAFGLALCADAFMYVWTKRQLVGEMERLVYHGGPAAVAITHAHNQLVWSPSHGDPLPPEGYRDLFESLNPRLFAEERLLDDVVAGGPLDLARRDGAKALAADPALTVVATSGEGTARSVLRPHALVDEPPVRGKLGLNPLYAVEQTRDDVWLRLAFPSEDYEEEYGSCRRYLPEEITIERTTLAAIEEGQLTPRVRELLRRRVVLDVPGKYH